MTPRSSHLLRAAGAAAGVVLFASLWLQWGADRLVRPPEALDAWLTYNRTDMLLAGAALVAVAGVVWPRRDGAWLSAAAGGAALLLIARELVHDVTGVGAPIALLAAAGIVAAALLRARPARSDLAAFPRRLWNEGEPVVRRGLRPIASPWFLGPVIALATWPVRSLAPSVGDDGSYIVALHLATGLGMDFGRDIAYTYGPLGYLTFPRLIDSGQLTAGFIYVGAVHVALATTLVFAVRRLLPTVVAALVVVIALDLLRAAVPDEISQPSLLAVVVCIGAWVITDPRPARSAWWPAAIAAGGVLAGTHVLIKLNTGAVMAVLVLCITLGATPRGGRRRAVLILAASGLIALLGAWAATGQSLTALPGYFRYSLDIVSGYAESFSAENGDRLWEYLLLPLVAFAIGAIVWLSARDLRLIPRIALVAIMAVYLFGAFKQGFVRHGGYAPTFFVACLLAGLAASRPAIPRLPVTLGLAVLATAALGTMRPLPTALHNTRGSVEALRAQIDQVRHPADQIVAAKAQMREAEAVPEEAVRLLRGRTTHIFPGEAAVAFAYPEIVWDPLPAFQALVAYRTSLTQLNADRFRSARAPERILRVAELTPFRDPLSWRELLCRYKPLFAGERWQVLGRIADRCAPEMRPIGRVQTAIGQDVPVPPARSDEAIFVSVHGLGQSITERLRTQLYKAYGRELIINGEASQRIAVDMAEIPSLIRVPEQVDAKPPFSLSLGAQTVRVEMSTDGIIAERKRIDRPVEIEFFALPVSSG